MAINVHKLSRFLVSQKEKEKQEKQKEIARINQQAVVESKREPIEQVKDTDTWFKAGAFDDGYQFGDIVKTILGTTGDIGVNALKGAGSLVEGVTDLLGYAGAGVADLFGADEFASDWKKNIQKNTVDEIFQPAEDYVDRASVLGDRSDAISQGLGQVAAIILTGGIGSAAGLGSAGVTALTTGITGLSGMGSGMSQAYQEGATDGEAVAYGTISGTAEALTELIFAGMGKSIKALGFSKGLSSADDILAKKLSSKISSQLGKNLVELGVKAGAEGTEEVLSGVAQAFGKKLTYMSEEELGKLIKDERLFDQFLTGAITSGIAQSGIVPGMKSGSLIEATKAGQDMITGLTQNEQAVLDKVYADRVAGREKSGELSKKQKTEIYDKVLEDMENGRISTDTIESILGGDTYRGYQQTVERESKLKKEIEELENIADNAITVKQRERLAEARKELEGLDTKTAKSNLFSHVDKLTAKDTRLRESYNERTRSGQKFTADLSQYDEKMRPTIQRAIDNGEINNTRTTHAFIEGLAKIEAEKGIGFDFTNNKKLAELGLTVAGRNVGGYVDGRNVTLNLSSSEALNKVVGHEVTHVFEGTEQYEALSAAMKEFVAEKGIDWDARVQEMQERYQNVKNADPEKELLADLVGEYLFTDGDFVKSLSTKNPGLFKRIYEEIKYLAKTFAGTKQGAALEKVKKAFADAYRAETKNPTADGGVRYVLSSSSAQNDITANYQKTVDSILQGTHTDTSSVLLGYTPDVYQELGMPSLPFVIGPGHIYSTVKTEAEARLENRYSKKMHYHGLGDNAVKNIYTAAQNPLMIIASKDVSPKTTPLRSTHSVVAIVDVGTGNQHLLLPVEITAKRTVNGEEMDVNVLSSAYNKNVSELVREAVALENIGEVGVYYIKKGATLPADSGVQFPVHLSNKIASSGIIHNFSEKVNMNIMDATQSQQFKRWFGDWQNHPENASKVVNADGTPKVVYHGTDKAFNVFASESGMYWFSEYEDYAESMMEERGGGEVKAVYLNMRNPYKAKLPPGQFSDPSYEAQILQNAKAAGHDGVIIENDTTDPLIAETFYVVFDPKQIKSATDNIGTFDSSNPDIRYSVSSEGETAAQDGWRVSGADVTLDEQAAAAEPDEPSSDSQVAEQSGLPEDSEPVAENEQEKPDELYGQWRMADPLDQKVEKLYRMMLREEISEEDYVAQLVKADRLYQKRGEQVEAALERVRDAYSRNSASSADSDQMTVPPETETKMTRLTRKVLHTSIMEKLRGALENAGFDLNELLSKAKRLSTFATVDNTPQRVIEKTFGYKAGQIINDLTVNKVALNESEGIRWLNGRVEAIKNLSKKYGIKPGSKESRAAQIYGEGFWVNEAGEYITYGDMELAADVPDVKKQERIKKLAKDPEVRKMYDETLEAINETRVRNGYPPIPKRADYFLHFRAMDDTFSRLGVPFNPNDIKAKDLPTDLNGMTADLKPGKPFFASEMHRKGDRTTYDLLGGLERYMNSAKNQIYHIDDIQTFRAFRNYIADMYGQANGLSDLDSLSPEEQEIRIKEVFDGHLSTFAKFLNEEANVLAGKTALIDRGIEGVLGRRAIQFLHTLNSQVGKNMVGWNVSSAGTNVLPIIQAMAKLPKADMLKAFAQTISNKFQNDGFVESDPALIRRRGADQFAKTFWQKISDPGYALMSAVDNLSSEVIVRAKYNELVRKQGMDSQQAHIRAGEWASRLMGDRSLGQMPQLYNSKTLGLITKFQLEVRNQLDVMGYDTIQEANAEGTSTAKKAAKITSTMVQLALFQHLFGQAYESIAGYNPAFDIVENLIKLFGFDDDEESEDTFGDNLEQAFLGLLEDMPYTGTFTGGRIPIESALPIKEVITGKDSYGNEKDRLETIGEALPYYILPGGYGQIKKTAAGLQMFDEDLPVAGSYTDSGNLRFPVEATAGNVAQAAVFGQYASQNARDYFDNGWAPLQGKQIQEFVALDIPIAQYRRIRNQLSKLTNLPAKVDFIDTLDLPVEKKNILVNNLVNRNVPIDMSNYDLYADFEEFDFAQKNEEKYAFLKSNEITWKQYNASEESRTAYNWAYQNPEKFEVSKAVADDLLEYREYSQALGEIKADQDSLGNAISGSRQEKVVQYLNSLDVEYGAKLVLYKMEYPKDNTYNDIIIRYVSGIEVLNYQQKMTILKELGFTAADQGIVTGQ